MSQVRSNVSFIITCIHISLSADSAKRNWRTFLYLIQLSVKAVAHIPCSVYGSHFSNNFQEPYNSRKKHPIGICIICEHFIRQNVILILLWLKIKPWVAPVGSMCPQCEKIRSTHWAKPEPCLWQTVGSLTMNINGMVQYMYKSKYCEK